jgi:hypothetical protein
LKRLSEHKRINIELSIERSEGGVCLPLWMKELEKENSRLKRLVAELSLDKQILKDIAEGNL